MDKFCSTPFEKFGRSFIKEQCEFEWNGKIFTFQKTNNSFILSTEYGKVFEGPTIKSIYDYLQER